jgi:hypothetical protein
MTVDRRKGAHTYGVELPFPCPTEHEEQATLIEMCALFAPHHPELELLMATPNGGKRHPATAARLAAEGVRAGYPDLSLDVARGGYHGLKIEMKRLRGGTVRPEQKWWHERLRAEGYRVEVCRGCDAAWAAISDYLGIVR